MSGIDLYEPEFDSEIDLHLTMYKNIFSSVIAYTRMDTIKIWYNRRFFSEESTASIAGTIVHEYIHNLGFLHIESSDHKSVPYAVGYLVESMVYEYQTFGELLLYHQVPYKRESRKKSP